MKYSFGTYVYFLFDALVISVEITLFILLENTFIPLISLMAGHLVDFSPHSSSHSILHALYLYDLHFSFTFLGFLLHALLAHCTTLGVSF